MTSCESLLPSPPPALAGRVLVAMSGGVDSSVVAAWLAQQGHDVVGMSMRLYAAETPGRSCCSPDDLLDARDVAERGGFPFYVANYQDAFRERVIDHFVDEYRRGRTPSPCVLCNDHLKFDLLVQRMRALGGSHLATGHYARLVDVDGDHGRRRALLRGVDRGKDQSYFLFGLPREMLATLLFPLGGLHKAQVRALAHELGLPTAEKAESQDICFVGSGSYITFVEERLRTEELRPGLIVRSTTGEVLGRHDGVHRFTVGQRRGLGVAYPEPLFVRGVDAETGTVHVGTQAEISEAGFYVHRANWLRWDRPPGAFEATIQIRYRHGGVAGRVIPDADDPSRARVELAAPERAVAPGQAAVFYDGDEVVGGGWIERVGA